MALNDNLRASRSSWNVRRHLGSLFLYLFVYLLAVGSIAAEVFHQDKRFLADLSTPVTGISEEPRLADQLPTATANLFSFFT